MIVCAAPNPSLDKLFEIERLDVGEIHRPVAFVARAGGKGFNVARVARALGHDVTAVGSLAGHTGRLVAALLSADGVPLRAVEGAGETRSSLSVHALADDTTTEFYEHGHASLAPAWPAFADAVLAATRDAGDGAWVTVSGTLPAGVPPGRAGELAARLRGAGARIAVDQRGEVLSGVLAAGCELVKVNGEEARELTGLDPRASLAALAARAPGAAVVVTLGTEGALLREPGGQVVHGRVAVRGGYPTGSGDAMLAGMVGHVDEYPGDWRGALAAGSGAAVANAEQPGAGSLDAARARALAAACVLEDA